MNPKKTKAKKKHGTPRKKESKPVRRKQTKTKPKETKGLLRGNHDPSELGLRGAKVKSRIRDFGKSIARRQNCNTECKVWPCVYSALSEVEGKCAVKDMSPGVKHKLARILLSEDGEGILEEMRGVVVLAGQRAMESGSLDDLNTYLGMLRRLKDACYGDGSVTNIQTFNLYRIGWGEEHRGEKRVEGKVIEKGSVGGNSLLYRDVGYAMSPRDARS